MSRTRNNRNPVNTSLDELETVFFKFVFVCLFVCLFVWFSFFAILFYFQFFFFNVVFFLIQIRMKGAISTLECFIRSVLGERKCRFRAHSR